MAEFRWVKAFFLLLALIPASSYADFQIDPGDLPPGLFDPDMPITGQDPADLVGDGIIVIPPGVIPPVNTPKPSTPEPEDQTKVIPEPEPIPPLNPPVVLPPTSPNNPSPEDSFVLTNRTCSSWNSFLQPVDNVLELSNHHEKDAVVTVYLYDQDGEVLNTKDTFISAYSERDILLHELEGWRENAVGTVCIESADSVLGRLAVYKWQENSLAFALSYPLIEGSLDAQTTTINTFSPSEHYLDKFTANWLEITNLSDETQSGLLTISGRSGELLAEEELKIPAKGRIDYSAHDIGQNEIAFAEWNPSNDEARFIFRNTRYFYQSPAQTTFLGATYIRGQSPDFLARTVQLPQFNQGFSVIEIVNPNQHNSVVILISRNAAGEKIGETRLSAKADSTEHFILTSLLQPETATVELFSSEELVAVVADYKLEGEQNLVYMQSENNQLGTSFGASFNTFLAQECDLVITNISPFETEFKVTMRTSSDKVLLGDPPTAFENDISGEPISVLPNETIRVDLCQHAPSNEVGIINLQSPFRERFIGHLERRFGGNGSSLRVPLQTLP